MVFLYQSLALSALSLVGAIPYSEYILAPPSRTIYPVSVYNINGTVSGASSLTTSNGSSSGSAVFDGPSSVSFDHLIDIGGIVSVDVASITDNTTYIGVTFSESSLWVNELASDSTADAGFDEPVWLALNKGPGTYTVDTSHVRGGFRYLTIVHNGTGTTNVSGVSTDFTAMPHWEDDALQNYTGWFHSNDEKLNRVWYAGAYTIQICTIDPTTGDSLIHLGEITSNDTISLPETVTWGSNTTISNGTSALVDGGKRDRLLWAGDMAVAFPSAFVSTNDMISSLNAIEALFLVQTDEGALPYAGYPFYKQAFYSWTYHLYSLIAVADYYRFTKDQDWLEKYWDQFKLGLDWSLSSIDESDLMNVTVASDWLRFGMGGHNIEANAILYHTLNEAVTLAEVLGDTDAGTNWTTYAGSVKAAANKLLWNETAGMFKDNETTTLFPQDGNVWAIKSNITLSSEQKTRIASNLKDRWTPYGPPALEAGDAISPFISSFELEAQFLSGNTQTALDLIRLMWADFMLDDPRMTNSTFIEGYSSDGSLHYAPYNNDPRVNHAHGWGTGPTSSLSYYVAGIQLLSAIGETWLIAPQPGDLTFVSGGYTTPLGVFSNEYEIDAGTGAITSMNISTPAGSAGSVRLPSPSTGSYALVQNETSVEFEVESEYLVAKNITGGNWQVVYEA
ncbi:glycoside hydrolase family 78 protein [Cylindrobasidium torrendii FP15055 ss-10]|uniref:Glycoside hydrolase family 78 protein n=1 Tax=Cylindrobasidium torrendii FP15055 ss-10 TaxID=1314674 RepID=A0A0D7BRY3_9AGAR|nr:glycoside hydrolase family 78 protein [Cylindrobasidium torrendii FP15055 ss-10]